MAKKSDRKEKADDLRAGQASETKGEFRHESLQDRESIVRYLNALSQGIASGQLTLGSQDEQLTLHPSGLLKLDVKARGKEDRTKLVFKISWKENGHGEHPILPEVADLPPVKRTKS